MKNTNLIIKRDIADYQNVDELIKDMQNERFPNGEYQDTLESLGTPFDFKDMKAAVEKLTEAIKNNKNICIWGDYDVDGTTSIYVTYNLLLKIAALLKSNSKISYYIPHREKEGYGVNNEGLNKIKKAGYDFIITVDCGIANTDQVKHAQEIGLDVIVTDHHEYPENPPQCLIINPHDGEYPFSKLSGCATAFKFMEALYEHNNFDKKIVYSYLDVVTISTIADLMDLVGENRTIVKYGLKLLNRNAQTKKRLWLNKLLDVAKVEGEIDSFTVGFAIAPRLNSVGRLSHNGHNLKFMLSTDNMEAHKYAFKINQLNEERKKLQDEMVKIGDALVQEKGISNSINIVVDGRIGVVGLAASNLLEKYYRPTTVFSSSVNPDIYKASARSIEGFNYFKEVIEENRDIIVKGGGHAQAAGIAVKKEDIEEFSRRVDLAVEKHLKKDPELLKRKLYIDCKLKAENIYIDFINKVNSLAPFGQGNPAPIFYIENLTVNKVIGVPYENPKHLQIVLSSGKKFLKCILFKRIDLLEEISNYSNVDIAFTASINIYQERKYVSLSIMHIKKSATGMEQLTLN